MTTPDEEDLTDGEKGTIIHQHIADVLEKGDECNCKYCVVMKETMKLWKVMKVDIE